MGITINKKQATKNKKAGKTLLFQNLHVELQTIRETTEADS